MPTDDPCMSCGEPRGQEPPSGCLHQANHRYQPDPTLAHLGNEVDRTHCDCGRALPCRHCPEPAEPVEEGR